MNDYKNDVDCDLCEQTDIQVENEVEADESIILSDGRLIKV